MPVVDGLTLLRQLGKRARRSIEGRVPAILMSGGPTAERAAAAHAAGASEVFDKPIDFRRLRAADGFASHVSGGSAFAALPS